MKKFFTGLWIGIVTALAMIVTFLVIKSRKSVIDFMADDAVLDLDIGGSPEQYHKALEVTRERITKAQAEQVRAEFMTRFGVKP